MPRHNWQRPRGRLDWVSIEAPSLAGNLLGDPVRRDVAVYLPEGYEESGEDYPLFVGLAPYTSAGPKLLNWKAFGESLPQIVDRLVEEKKMGPVVLAMPDGFTSLGGNQYVDSPVFGNWAAFLSTELVGELEGRYRLRRGGAHRAVFGKSSGGYGALVQGMLHGDRWGAVACHSGDIGFDWVYRRDLPQLLDALAPHGGRVDRFVEALRTAPEIRGSEWHALMLVAMAASYDPEPSLPYGVQLPLDPETAELYEERWSRWRAHDPLWMIERPDCRESLRALRSLFFDCGNRDQYFLHYGARALRKRLERYEIAHRHEEFDGTHSGIDHRLDRSLPLLYDALG